MRFKKAGTGLRYLRKLADETKITITKCGQIPHGPRAGKRIPIQTERGQYRKRRRMFAQILARKESVGGRQQVRAGKTLRRQMREAQAAVAKAEGING